MKNFNQYVGIPFTNLGRIKTGADCWGLARIVLKEQYGIILPELLSYLDALNPQQVAEVINFNTPLISGEELLTPEAGCIVVMSKAGLGSHVGVYIGNNKIIHTTRQTGAIIEKLNSNRLKTKIEGFYRVSKDYYTR